MRFTPIDIYRSMRGRHYHDGYDPQILVHSAGVVDHRLLNVRYIYNILYILHPLLLCVCVIIFGEV